MDMGRFIGSIYEFIFETKWPHILLFVWILHASLKFIVVIIIESYDFAMEFAFSHWISCITTSIFYTMVILLKREIQTYIINSDSEEELIKSKLVKLYSNNIYAKITENTIEKVKTFSEEALKILRSKKLSLIIMSVFFVLILPSIIPLMLFVDNYSFYFESTIMVGDRWYLILLNTI